MIANFSIFPIGQGESLSLYITKVFTIIKASGLPYELHEMGTNLEGEWPEVMKVIKQCLDKLLEAADRVYVSITIDERKGKPNRLKTKVASALAKI